MNCGYGYPELSRELRDKVILLLVDGDFHRKNKVEWLKGSLLIG